MGYIDFIVSIGMIVLFTMIFLLFVYQTKTRHRGAPDLTFALFLGVIAAIIRSLAELPPFAEDWYVTNFRVMRFAMLIWSIQFLFIWRFMERLDNKNIPSTHVWSISSTFTASLLSNIAVVFFNLQQYQRVHDFFYSLFGFIAFGLSAKILYQVYVDTEKETTALIQFVAVAVLSISFVIDFLKFYVPGIFFVGNVLQLLGMLIYVISLLYNIDYIYRLPCKIQDLIIFSRDGPGLFSIGMKADEKSIDEYLLSGLIVALNSLVQELKPKIPDERLDLLLTTKRVMYLEFGTNFVVALVASKLTWFLERSTKRLLKILDEDPDMLECKEQGISLPTEKTLAYLKTVFPYLPLNEMHVY